MPLSKADRIEAVNLTIEKWINLEELTEKFFDEVDSTCGFCEKYICGPESCPAKKICTESSNDITNINIAIEKRIKKNLSWLRGHKKRIRAEKI